MDIPNAVGLLVCDVDFWSFGMMLSFHKPKKKYEEMKLSC
jgi:hypothetical protein